MKKFLTILSSMCLLATTAVQAQKINLEEVNSKLAKADANSEHAKKGTKASTWIARADAYADAIKLPTNTLFLNADISLVELKDGKGKRGTRKVGSQQFTTLIYPYYTAFAQNGKIVAWTPSKEAHKGALGKAIQSYNKAVELDPGVAAEVKKKMSSLIDFYKQLGDASIKVGEHRRAADAFMSVNNLQKQPSYKEVDPTLLFLAGYMLTIDGEKTPASYVRGENVLNQAIKANYDAVEDKNKEIDNKERGNIYYYAFHCAYAQREKNKDKLQAAKKFLEMGIAKYPANEKIFQGLLQLYTGPDSVGDPKELLPTIEASIAKDPKNSNAWFGRGRIYYALKDYDECINSFKKVVELEPAGFDSNFYLGLFYMLKGDAELEKFNARDYTDQAKYDADLATLNKIYAESIPCFEAAHKAKPSDFTTLEYLKQLCFRLRDLPGVMDKYNKYNELFKAAQAKQ